MRIHDEVLTAVRRTADELGPDDRARFMRDVVREVYDSEKETGPGGDGLDGRDGPHRRLLGSVTDAAEAVVETINDGRLHEWR